MLLIFDIIKLHKKQIEYICYPVSSIQYQASCCTSDKMLLSDRTALFC